LKYPTNMSAFTSTETLKDDQTPESSVTSTPTSSAHDEKKLAIPSLSSDTITVESQCEQQHPYHVFTRVRKLQVVCIVSLAAIFSPLSSNIYFPALSAVSTVSGKKQFQGYKFDLLLHRT